MPIILQNKKRYSPVISNDIKALPTVDTASGSIATFETDMTENLIEVVCDIQYSQASGTPTPDNPLPITTFSEMNVVQMSDITNKSFFDGLLLGTHNFYKFTGSESWTYSSANGFFYADLNWYSSNYGKNNSRPISTNGIQTFIVNNKVVRVYLSQTPSITSDTDMNTVFTSDSYMIYELAEPRTPTITKAQFETLLTAFGIDGSLYNIPFGQTVAKGTLNVGTGKLTITHLYQLFTGDNSEAWTSSPSGGHYGYLIARGDLVVGQIAKSNLFECVESSGQADNYNFYIGNSYATFYYDDATTLTAWRTFLSNNNLQLVGELTTPLTVQLDSNQVQALLNENNIWCDTGDTSVKYILSVGKAIS